MLHVNVTYPAARQQPVSTAVSSGRLGDWSHHSTATCAGVTHFSVSCTNTQQYTARKLQDPLTYSNPRQPQPDKQHQSSQQQPQHVRPWPRPEQDICRAISLKLKRADSTVQTLAVIAAHAARFNEINTALAYAQIARHLRFDTAEGSAAALSSSSYNQLQQLARQQADKFNPRQVNMILTSMAWMHGGSSSSTFADQPQQQSDHTKAAAAAAAAMIEQLTAPLATRLELLLNAAEPEDICHGLWAITKLQQLRNPPCARLLIAATAHSLQSGWIHMLTGKPLSSLLWVHAQYCLLSQQQQQQQQQYQQQQQQGSESSVVMQQQQQQQLQQQGGSAFVTNHHGQQQDGWQQPAACDLALQQQWQQLLPDLVAAAMHECSQPGFLGTWTPQELSMLLWSCAVVKLNLGSFAEPDRTAGSEQQRQQQQLLLPYAVLEQVCTLAEQQVVRFTPQGIANTCWAVAKLLVPVDHHQQQQQQQRRRLPQPVQQWALGLFETFTASAAAQLHYYKPQEVANIVSACAKMRYRVSKAFQTAVSHYVTSNSHMLSPRDTFELLVGLRELKCSVEPCVTHALVHRLNQVGDLLQPYELAAAAWVVARAAEQQQQQVGDVAAAAAVEDAKSQDLGRECLAAVLLLLDKAAAAVGTRYDAAASHDPAAAGAAAAKSSDMAAVILPDQWQQLLMDSGGRPLVMLLWAAAATGYGSSTAAAAAVFPGSFDLDEQQQQEQQDQQRLHFVGYLLQQVQQQVATCSVSTLVQLLVTLVRLLPTLSQQQQQQQQQQEVMYVCAAAEARLLPLLPGLPVEQVVWAAWAIVKLRTTAVSSSSSDGRASDATSSAATAAAAAAAAGSGSMHKCQSLLEDCNSTQCGAFVAATAAAATAAVEVDMQHTAAAAAADFLAASLRALQQQQQQQRIPSLPGHTAALLLQLCARTQVTPDNTLLLPLLAAAEQYVLQLTGRQQLLLLWSLAKLQQQGQQQQQHFSRLVRLLCDELLSQVQHQLMCGHEAFAAASAASSSSTSRGRNKQTPLAAARIQHQKRQQQQWLGARELATLVAACIGVLEQQQQQQSSVTELVLAAVELWQQRQQQRLAAANVTSADMTAALSVMYKLSSAAAPAAVQLQLPDLMQDVVLLLQGFLQQQQQQQQQAVISSSEQVAIPLHAAPEVLAAAAAAAEVKVLVLALQTFAKLRYQPQPQQQQQQQLYPWLLHRLVSNLQHMTNQQVVTAMHALVMLALPMPQQLLAVAAAVATAAVLHGNAGCAGQHVAADRALPYSSQVKLLWCIMVSQCRQIPAAAAAVSNRLIMRLASHVLHGRVVQQQQLLLQRQPELLLLLVQCRQLLVTQRYAAVHALLSKKPRIDLLQPDLITDQLMQLSKVLLDQAGEDPQPDQIRGQQMQLSKVPGGYHSSSDLGGSRKERMLRLLHSSRLERLHILQQHLAAVAAPYYSSSRSNNSSDARLQLTAQQQQQRLAALMPLWIQQQLQHLGLREVHKELTAAGVAASALNYRHLANGDVALLVSMDPSVANACSSSSDSSSSSSKGANVMAVVLDSSSSRAANTGRLLGPSLCRNYLLEDWGCKVVSMPMECWLPEWLNQRPHLGHIVPIDVQQQQHFFAEQRKRMLQRLKLALSVGY